MAVVILAQECVCGARVEGTPRPDGTLPCTRCARVVVLDRRAAAAASPVADDDTGLLASPASPEQAREAALSHSLLGHAFTPGPVPERVGPYRVLGRLGAGGMGVVYKAHDDGLDRPVALKVIAPRVAGDPDAARRLLREARSTAAVTHENVVRIYSAGETEDGSPYLVMELVQGRDLREVLEREGPLGWRRAVVVAEQAAAGLAAAHGRGLVHRDVKPANLLLDEQAEREPVLKIADFGLAKARATDASLTATGTIAGTALYVAPEVAREGAGDHRADMYSLGATLFHLLAGQAPYEGKTPAAVILAHMTEPVPDLARRRPDLPEGLVAVVERLLAKAPGERYDTWSALQDDLARVREGKTPHVASARAFRPALPIAVREAPRAPAVRETPRVRAPMAPGLRFVPRQRRGAPVEKSLLVALLFWLPPFGLLGFHRFYLGRFATGLLYMPTLGLLGLGWLHDLLVLPRLVSEASPPPAAQADHDGDAIAAAYILWFFFGIFGVHRFYCGRVQSGALYFFTLGGFFLGWALDFLAIPALVREARRQES